MKVYLSGFRWKKKNIAFENGEWKLEKDILNFFCEQVSLNYH
jgi:hypothetical protein